MWTGFVLVGLGLSRLDLTETKTLVKTFVAGVTVAAAGYGLGYLGRALVGTASTGSDDSVSSSSSGSGTGSANGSSGAESGSTSASGGSSGVEEFSDSGANYGGPTFDTSGAWPDATLMLEGEPHSSTPIEALGSGGVAVAVIAACCLLPLVARRVLRPLAAVGSMALTAYAAHIVMFYIWPDTFSGTGMGDTNNMPLVIMAGGILLGCTIWSMTLGRGPLERLVRWVSVRAASLPGGARVPAADTVSGASPAATASRGTAP